ncbi:hypothetical protein BH09SUM1_BH09SUM1_12530 [soil metagenome]
MRETSPFLFFTKKLNALGVRYMVTGSVAVILYGEPRLTHDVDLVVVLERGQIARLREAFPEDEFYCPSAEVIALESARAQRGHFNIIHRKTGFKADFFLSGQDHLHAWGFTRVREMELEGSPFFVAPPEYVIVRKLEYFREGGSEKHLRDIRSMLELSSTLIDHAELERQITARGLNEAWRKVDEGR